MAYNSIQQSQLDYILISASLMYNVQKVEIGHSVYSDHSPVLLKLSDKNPGNKGRGFWKFNTSLLKDLEDIEQINNLIWEEQNKQTCGKRDLSGTPQKCR